jgi:PTS system nitrogen regulatory IIA component
MIAAAYNQHSYYLKTISHFSAKFKDKDLRDAMLTSLNEQEIYNLLMRA